MENYARATKKSTEKHAKIQFYVQKIRMII